MVSVEQEMATRALTSPRVTRKRYDEIFRRCNQKVKTEMVICRINSQTVWRNYVHRRNQANSFKARITGHGNLNGILREIIVEEVTSNFEFSSGAPPGSQTPFIPLSDKRRSGALLNLQLELEQWRNYEPP